MKLSFMKSTIYFNKQYDVANVFYSKQVSRAGATVKLRMSSVDWDISTDIPESRSSEDANKLRHIQSLNTDFKSSLSLCQKEQPNFTVTLKRACTRFHVCVLHISTLCAQPHKHLLFILTPIQPSNQLKPNGFYFTA